MNEYQAFDPTSYLEHYGVKGMRWGVRRVRDRISDYRSNQKKLNERNKHYSTMNRKRDEVLLGSKGVKRINKRMNKGLSYKKAFRREIGGQVTKNVLSLGAIGAASFLAADGGTTIRRIRNTQAARRGAREAAKAIVKIGAGSVVNLKRSQYSII